MRGPTILAVVTDSVKSIGNRIICTMLQNTQQPLTIYMTGPSYSREKYDVTFKQDRATVMALRRTGSEVKFAELDLEYSGSIKAFRDHLLDTYGASHGARPLSILINSPAAIFKDAKKSVDRTYFGSKNLTRLLLPIMKRTGDSRIVNVSIPGGQARSLIPNEDLADQFSFENLTEKNLDNLMRKYQEDAASGKQVEEGWSRPSGPNGPSVNSYNIPRIALAAHAFVLAKENPGFLINASGGDSWRYGIERYRGALTPTLLALGDLGGATGGFWIGGQRIDWEAVQRRL
ncbi:hypothetical protein TWF281_000417 [Arthrobotrys megalospora]